MKAVVTGGSGFVGSFIAEELAKDPGCEVTIFDIARPELQLKKNMRYVEGDVRYYEEVEMVIRGAEEVYDIAGVLGTFELMGINPRAIQTNIQGAVHVLEACRKNDVKRVFHPTKPNDWLNTYSITKFAAEQFCLMYQQNYGMSIAALKWFNAYGPRQHLYPIRKAVPLFIVQAMHNKPLQVFGDGSQTVDLIYAEDVAKVALKATRKMGRVGKILDLGSGIPITVKELAELIIKHTGSRSKVEHLPMRPGEPEKSNIAADVEPLKKHLDVHFTSFEDGIEKTIQYYKNVDKQTIEKTFRYFNI